MSLESQHRADLLCNTGSHLWGVIERTEGPCHLSHIASAVPKTSHLRFIPLAVSLDSLKMELLLGNQLSHLC